MSECRHQFAIDVLQCHARLLRRQANEIEKAGGQPEAMRANQARVNYCRESAARLESSVAALRLVGKETPA